MGLRVETLPYSYERRRARPSLCSPHVWMRGWERRESFWHEPRQADSEVTTRRRTAKEEQRKHRARAHADSEAVQPLGFPPPEPGALGHPN